MTTNDVMTEMIKRFRKKHNLSMSDMAEKLDISINTLRNKCCKNSPHKFTVDELDRLVELTNDKAASRGLDRLITPSDDGIDEIKDLLIDVHVVVGEMTAKVNQAVEDGKITPNEASEIAPYFSTVNEAKTNLQSAVINASQQRRAA